MLRLSIEEYWEKLEGHNWFYAWTYGDDEYKEYVVEAKDLFHLSQLSWKHRQLYAAYWTGTYQHVSMEGDEVLDLEPPIDGKPEAA